jgi:exonuclease SbcC
MKILAIRGANLASLAGDFSLDFREEPLASTGLFAIVGPTGSGKSTLLDALCLALYGEYPRLSANSTEKLEDLSGHTLSAGDERNILTRGAGAAYAEVDFTALDGIDYRARWEVRRAREKADGSLQASKVSLIRLRDQVTLADKKKECYEQVKELTGLSFDQFCRTALLSQGRFDAFLLANQNERSDLLEKITGTGIYSQISIQTYQEEANRANELRLIRTQIGALQLLSEEEVKALRVKISSLETEALQAAQSLAGVQRQQQLRQNEANAEAAATQAAQELAAAQEQDRELAPARERLAALVRAETLRPAFLDLRQANRALAEKQQEAESAARASARQQDAVLLMQSRQDTCQRAAAEADAAVQHWTPQWEAAEEADQLLRQAEVDCQQKRSHYENTLRELAQKQNEANQLRRKADHAAAEYAALESWLAANRFLAGLNLAPIESLLQVRAGFPKRTFAPATLDEVIQELATISRAAEDQRRADSILRLAQLDYWQAEAEKTRLRATLTVLDAQLAEATRSLDLTQLSASEQAEAMRAALADGDPCPVCGATHHPYAGQPNPFHALLGEMQSRVSHLKADRDRILAQVGKEEQRGAQARNQIEQAQATMTPSPADLDFDAERQAAQAALHEANQRIARHEELTTLHSYLTNQQQLEQCLAPLGVELATVTANPRQWLTSMHTRLGEFAEKQARLTALLPQKDQLAQKAAGAEAQVTTLTGLLQERQREFMQAEATLDQRRQTRSLLLSGQPLAAHRQPFLDRQKQTTAELQRAREDLSAAQAALIAAQSHRDKSQQAFDTQSARTRATQQAWLDACAQQGLEPNEAQALLEAKDKDSLQQQISLMDSLLQQRQGAHQQAEQQLANARQLAANLPTWNEIASKAAELQIRRDTAQHALGAERQKLADHESKLAVSAALREQESLASQQYELWREISDAIGSADGKKFRNFVQSLTLDHLTYRANQQLSRLAPRYRLERANDDSLGLVVIDADMADSRRATNSLSGGERFLVSLGLALGLASLEGRESFVDSLFIDEGFGTLDPESLDQVMAALEALPSSGRRVGVISHVEAMKERIAVQVEVRKKGSGRSAVRIQDRAATGYGQP